MHCSPPPPPSDPTLLLSPLQKFQRHNPRSDKFPIHKFHHVEFWCGDATNTSSRCDGPSFSCMCCEAWRKADAQRCHAALMPGGVWLAPAAGCRHCPLMPSTYQCAPSPLAPPSPASLIPSCRFGYGLGMALVGRSDQGTGNQHCASYVMQVGTVSMEAWAGGRAGGRAAVWASRWVGGYLGGCVVSRWGWQAHPLTSHAHHAPPQPQPPPPADGRHCVCLHRPLQLPNRQG